MINIIADILIATLLAGTAAPVSGEFETSAETEIVSEEVKNEEALPDFLPEAENDYNFSVLDDNASEGISLSDEEYWSKTEESYEPEPNDQINEEQEKEESEESLTESSSNESNFDYDIASYITKYSTAASNEARNYNMLLASDSINGVILNPGEVFSYNDVILSKRTAERDYKNAPVIVNGKLEDGIGGGICQISSTLYNAALYSKMTIVKRRNHSLKVSYMPAGRDATVSWGSIDLVFRNDLEVPVKIESKMADGTLKIRFLSTENPNIGSIKINVFKDENNGYYLERLVDGVSDYSAYSKYKD